MEELNRLMLEIFLCAINVLWKFKDYINHIFKCYVFNGMALKQLSRKWENAYLFIKLVTKHLCFQNVNFVVTGSGIL